MLVISRHRPCYPTVRCWSLAGKDQNGDPIATAEVYDQATALWTVTGSLVNARFGHTATLLPNNQVLVAGGGDNYGNVSAAAELYDPTTGVWTPTGSLGTARLYTVATLLPNGKVLVAGGL